MTTNDDLERIERFALGRLDVDLQDVLALVAEVRRLLAERDEILAQRNDWESWCNEARADRDALREECDTDSLLAKQCMDAKHEAEAERDALRAEVERWRSYVTTPTAVCSACGAGVPCGRCYVRRCAND